MEHVVFEAQLCSEISIFKEKSNFGYADHPEITPSLHVVSIKAAYGRPTCDWAEAEGWELCLAVVRLWLPCTVEVLFLPGTSAKRRLWNPWGRNSGILEFGNIPEFWNSGIGILEFWITPWYNFVFVIQIDIRCKCGLLRSRCSVPDATYVQGGRVGVDSSWWSVRMGLLVPTYIPRPNPKPLAGGQLLYGNCSGATPEWF